MSVDEQISILSAIGFRIVHVRGPAWESVGELRRANAGSIAIGYNGQRNVAMETPNGGVTTRNLPAGSIRLNGPAPTQWLRVNSPAEMVEITASPALKANIAESLAVERHRDLADAFGWEDPIVWCFATRLRQAATGLAPANELYCDTLVRKLYERVYIEQFGGRPIERPRSESGLDERRLGRVFDYIEAHLAKPMTISDLAAVAAYSPFHFARAFKVAVGFPPHAYLAVRRLEAARRLALRSHLPIEQIAENTGFINVSHFRRRFRRELGMLPSQMRRSVT
ncbi:AraC family transcriptional regulator [Rhizobium sp. MHM7A]|uniref:helix-turn-helix domain-containing protein n=1 Tax=Rhizobium sp. MHM7A TaxID=2583233 RepID=UPI00110614B8|nr:AraC family transcriptional regulator [Rhizobium sp. MHM7A]TLX13056.1 helix-turn-helix transcriptional regulator [Rhizobium sp. MHM7A]